LRIARSLSFESLERREARTFTLEETATLAEWGAKTAIALIFCEEGLEDLVPEDERYALRNTGLPSPHAWIGFAAWDGGMSIHASQFSIDEDPGESTPHAYNVVATTRRVALKVYRTYERIAEDAGGIDTTLLKQVWPVREEPFVWPPFGVVNRLDLLIVYFP
jgi:hypothetical protein